jgi:hypothetical protein
MQEFSLITADNAYYTCLGNYDPVKDEPISENSNSNLEVNKNLGKNIFRC